MENGYCYLVEVFRNSFFKEKNKRIAIYGTGIFAENILNGILDYNIVGILDGYKNSGSFCGYDIINYDELLNRNAEMIVILAAPRSVSLIFNRIYEFCKINNIKVFDVFGENLIENSNKACFGKSEELIALIDKNEAISFDIFDTLLVRKVLDPLDIFKLMGEKINDDKFAFERYECQRKLENPNIFQIYDEYKKNNEIDEDDEIFLRELEFNLEKSVLMVREDVKDIFEYAVNSNKKVNLISDMYLPKSALVDILECFGIKGYDDIFVSCDNGLLKSLRL